jgi:hypothetical protein
MDINDPRHPMNSFNRFAREEQARLTAREIERQRKLNRRKEKNSIGAMGNDIGKLGKEVSSIDPKAILLLVGIFISVLLVLLPATVFIMLYYGATFWSSFGYCFTSGSSWLWSIAFWVASAGSVYYYIRKRRSRVSEESSNMAITPQKRRTKSGLKFCFHCGESLKPKCKKCPKCGESLADIVI